MSGIFGVADAMRQVNIADLANKIAHTLTHYEWIRVQSACDEQAAIGSAGIGIFNSGIQPVWNADRTIALVMAGEFNKVDETAPSIHTDEQTALYLYEKYGDDFAARVEGIFVIAIYDKLRRKMVITNDRWGLYPTYYTYKNSRLVFAPEAKAVLLDPGLEAHLDRAAMAQYLRWQFLIGDRTFFEDVLLLTNAASMVYDFDSGSLSIHSYWDFSKIEKLEGKVSFDEAVEETARRLKAAVNRLAERSHNRLGLYLTSGLDSRAILGFLDPVFKPVAVTFGRKDSRDMIYAAEIARRAGLEHHTFEFENGKWVQQYAPLHLDLTEGFHSWIHMHGITILPQVRQLMDVNLSGFEGVELNWDNEALLQAPDEIAFNVLLFHSMITETTWPSLTEPEYRSLFDRKIVSEMIGLAWESFLVDIKRYSHLPFDMRTAAFSRLNPDRRFFQYYIMFNRSHIEQRFPFCDYEYQDFMYGLPASYRHARKLRKAVIARFMPALGKVPYDKDNMPITNGKAGFLAAKMIRKGKSTINRYVRPIFPEHEVLHSDYESWLRTDLRAWGEDLLLGDRILSRGIYNPASLKSLWSRQLSGLEPDSIGKVAPIMTLEMITRRFIDGEVQL